MRVLVAAVAVCFSLVGLAAAQGAHAAIKKTTHIEAQGLEPALHQFAKDRDVQVVFRSEVVDDLRTQGAAGDLTVSEALTQLLSGTGLTFQYLDENTVSIFPKARGSETPQDLKQGGADSSPEGRGNSFWNRFRLAQADTSSATSNNTGSEHAPQAQPVHLEEVVVTAQKRSERLQDVPVPVTALDTATLAEQSQNRLQDYFTQVPGLTLISTGSGTQELAIRGITTGGYANPTVGVTIDDVPYGSSTNLGDGQNQYPDLDPSDLSSIEVLRGPQGTLYGASSIGGLIKFVTKDPSTEALTGRVQVLGNGVDGGELGFGARGSVNVPIGDTFALRASAFTRRDPGYIGNVLTGGTDVNRVDVHGGRLSALWHLSDTISLKVGALLQDTDGDAPSVVDADATLQPAHLGLQQTGLPGTGQFSLHDRAYSATLNAALGSVDFTSVSGYNTHHNSQATDASALNGLADGFFQVQGTFIGHEWGTNKFTQEFRLSSAGEQRLEWLAGVFYTHEATSADEFYGAVDPASGSHVGVIQDFNFPSTLSEYALFGDVTVHFTDRFDVQVGGRESQSRQVYNETDTGYLTQAFFGAPSPFVNPTEHTKGNAFTYLVTPELKITPDLMVYARLSSGYRVGGPNLNAVVYQAPIQYQPDRLYNYELGVKGELLDRKLTFDASAYYMHWSRIQLSYFNANTTFLTNGQAAKSQGLEVAVTARPVRGLTIKATASVNDAELTQTLPATAQVVGSAGEQLPFSSRFSGSLSAQQEIALVGGWTGFAGGSLSYVGKRYGVFTTAVATPRSSYPAYGEIDLRVGARNGLWTANLFANNVANRLALLGSVPSLTASPSGATYTDLIYIQPRTVGLSVSREF